MGGSKGRRQKALLKELNRHWNNGTPFVRLVPAGTARAVWKKTLHAAKRLAERNPPEVVLIRLWDVDSIGRRQRVTFAARPGAQVDGMEIEEIADVNDELTLDQRIRALERKLERAN
jgi:hypothetical protein